MSWFNMVMRLLSRNH